MIVTYFEETSVGSFCLAFVQGAGQDCRDE